MLRPINESRSPVVDYLRIAFVILLTCAVMYMIGTLYSWLFTKELTLCGTVESATIILDSEEVETRVDIKIVGYPQFVFNGPNPTNYLTPGKLVQMNILLPPGTATGPVTATKVTVVDFCT